MAGSLYYFNAAESVTHPICFTRLLDFCGGLYQNEIMRHIGLRPLRTSAEHSKAKMLVMHLSHPKPTRGTADYLDVPVSPSQSFSFDNWRGDCGIGVMMRLQNTIKAVVRPGDESGFVAECVEIAVVTQGNTLDQTIANLREAIYLHLEGEDLTEMGLAANPTVVVRMEDELHPHFYV